jgi:hypothetical protein
MMMVLYLFKFGSPSNINYFDQSHYYPLLKLFGSFIPIISSQENIYTNEASLKYFFSSSPSLNLPIIFSDDKISNKSNNHYEKCTLICNYNPTSNKNRGSPITLMIPKSNRRTKMNKQFIDNNCTKDCTNNLNTIPIKNKFTNIINCINISTGRIRRRNKPNITTKNLFNDISVMGNLYKPSTQLIYCVYHL